MSIADIPTPLRVGPESNGMLMTPEEFDAVDDWEESFRYELVHGVLVVTPPAAIGERKPNDELGHWLLTYRDMHPQGSSLDDTASEHTIATRTGRRRADRVVWAGLGRVPAYDHDPPSIAIEFVAGGAVTAAGTISTSATSTPRRGFANTGSSTDSAAG